MTPLALATSQHLRGCENWFVLVTASCPKYSSDHCFHMIVLSLICIEASRSVPYYPENLYYSIPPRLPIWEITAYWPHIKKKKKRHVTNSQGPNKILTSLYFLWHGLRVFHKNAVINCWLACKLTAFPDTSTKKVQGKHAEDTSNAEARQQGHSARNLNPIKQWQRE